MISAQLYGLFVVSPIEWDDASATPLDAFHAAGNVKTKTFDFPGVPVYFGYRATTAIDYNNLVTQGVLGLYIYPFGSSANKVLLASLNIVDGSAVGVQYRVRVPVVPPLSVSQGHAVAPVANFIPGDQLAVEFITQGAGGTYKAGQIVPVLIGQYRGETLAYMTHVVDLTPAGSGISAVI